MTEEEFRTLKIGDTIKCINNDCHASRPLELNRVYIVKYINRYDELIDVDTINGTSWVYWRFEKVNIFKSKLKYLRKVIL